MSQALTVQQDFSRDQLKVIKATVAKATTMEQFLFFIEVCKHTGLSPFARQIYAVVRGSDMTIQVSIDGYRVLAERTGKYAGQIGPEWCDETGEWKDVWLSSTPPVAARVGVLRRDFEKPIWGVARHAAYEQASSPLWRKMPDVMLAKCAESLALRKAFPAQLSGLYTGEEMAQADGPLSTPVVTETPHDESAPIVDSEIVSEAPQTPQNDETSNHTDVSTEAVSRRDMGHSEANSNLARLIAKAKERAKTLGMASNIQEWYAFTAECLGEVLASEKDITLDRIARINGRLTQIEKERAAA